VIAVGENVSLRIARTRCESDVGAEVLQIAETSSDAAVDIAAVRRARSAVRDATVARAATALAAGRRAADAARRQGASLTTRASP
jgi:hypothetical protein